MTLTDAGPIMVMLEVEPAVYQPEPWRAGGMTLEELEKLEYCVIMPHVPYLARHKKRVVVLTRYPFAGINYSYEQALEVLKIFTARWKTGGGKSLLEPYMEGTIEGGGICKVSLKQLQLIADAEEFSRGVADLDADDVERTARVSRPRKTKP